MEEEWKSVPGPPRPAFRLRTRKRGSAVVVELHGEVDLSTAGQVRAALQEAISKEPALVVADLSRVDLLDSTGIGTLIDAANSVAEGCEFALLAPGGLQARGVLSVSGILDQITVYESEDEIRPDPGGTPAR